MLVMLNFSDMHKNVFAIVQYVPQKSVILKIF